MKRIIGIVLLITGSSVLSNAKTPSQALTPLFAKYNSANNISDSDTIKKPSGFLGYATYYAQKFEGCLTATGEIFHHSNFTAASNVFGLNTWVKVTNLLTGTYIIVRINDRMHQGMSQKGRILDLTYAGAKKLKIINRGVAKVRVEALADVADD